MHFICFFKQCPVDNCRMMIFQANPFCFIIQNCFMARMHTATCFSPDSGYHSNSLLPCTFSDKTVLCLYEYQFCSPVCSYCPTNKLTFHSLILDESVYYFHHLKILCFDEDIHTGAANSVLRKYMAFHRIEVV